MNKFDNSLRRFQLTVLLRYGWAVGALQFSDELGDGDTTDGEYWL